MPTSSRNWRFLVHGAVAGALLALVENAFAITTGYNLPLAYLGAVALFDIGLGLAAGLGLVFLSSRESSATKPPFSATVLPLCLVMAFVFWADKGFAAARYRGYPGSLGILFVLLAVGALWWPGRRLLAGWPRTKSPILAAYLSFFLLALLLVGFEVIARQRSYSYLSFTALATFAALALTLATAAALATRFTAGRDWDRFVAGARAAPVVVGAAIAIVLAVWQWHVPRELDIPEDARKSVLDTPVILISIDTLRADHVSSYGYHRETTPRLDAFAKDSVLYENAFSPSSWTLPAHASMFTGTFPKRHAAHYPESAEAGSSASLLVPPRGVATPATPLSPDNETLAELVARLGYRTAAVVANGAYFHPSFGLAQGFDFYDDREKRYFGYEPLVHDILRHFPFVYHSLTKPYRTADEITRVATHWLSKSSHASLFLFLNYMEPHQPYGPPAPYFSKFDGARTFVSDPDRQVNHTTDLSRRELEHFIALYDGEIAFVDHSIGVLLDTLKELQLYERALIIVTSDHGEFFGEHGLWEHTVGPYDPVHRVPLIVKYPFSKTRGVVERWETTTNILPTVLDVIGADAPPGVHGTPLGDESASPRHLVAEQYLNTYLAGLLGGRHGLSYRSLYDDPWKLVLYSDGTSELFNLEQDPGERTELSSSTPLEARRLRKKLESYVDAIVPVEQPSGEGRVMNEEELRRLESLGYIR